MKTPQSPALFCCLLFTAALALFGSGCASPKEHSFNQDFNQSLSTAPMYFVQDDGDSRFYVTVQQGRTVPGQARIIDLKRAASTVAENECQKRGWKSWDLGYVMERDQGWMHIVKAAVTPKKSVEYNGTPKTGQP